MSRALAQRQQIYNWLLQGHTLTPREASDMFGCDRLAARIFEIKGKDPAVPPVLHEGESIEVELVDVGLEGKRVAQYSLRGIRPQQGRLPF